MGTFTPSEICFIGFIVYCPIFFAIMVQTRRDALRAAVTGISVLAGCASKSGTQTSPDIRSTAIPTSTTKKSDDGTETTTEEPPQNSQEALSWSYEIGHDIQFAPTVTEEVVYVPSENLYALGLDGTLSWTFETEDRIKFSPIARDAIYLASPKVRAVETDGTERWTYSGETVGTPYPLAVSEDTFYVGTQGHVGSPNGFELLAIATDTGEERWRTEIGTPSEAIIDGDTALVVSPERVRAFDTTTGKQQWAIDVPGMGHPSIVGLSGDTLLIHGDDLHAIQTDDGAERWGFSDDQDYDGEAETVTAALLDGSTVYVAFYDDVSAIDVENGTLRWTAGPYRDDIGSLAFQDGVVFAAGGNRLALNSESGAERWVKHRDDNVWAIVNQNNGLYLRGDSWIEAVGTDGSSWWRRDFGIDLSQWTTSREALFVGTRKLGSNERTPTSDGIAPGTLFAFEM